MGALHVGHQSLITIAREFSQEVVVSVFVNPFQFEDKNDFRKYPSTPERDEILAKEAGATLLWRPEFSEIYPEEIKKIESGSIGEKFEGIERKGHFDGVLTVVNRLFEIVRPRFAIFGEKDFQQLFLIKKMAEQLHPNIEIISAPTIREESGLALSSRNVQLSKSGKATAAVISATLQEAQEFVDLDKMRSVLNQLKNVPNFILDYAEIIDEESFELATPETQKIRALVAGWVEGVRLIDNMAMSLVRA